MPKFISLFIGLVAFGLCSCSVIMNAADYELDPGYYHYKRVERFERVKDKPAGKVQKKVEKVYIDIDHDTVHIFNYKNRYDKGSYRLTDSIPNFYNKPEQIKYILSETYFNLAVILIPFKLRTIQKGPSPARLNTNVNAGVLIGYRSDRHLFIYDRTFISDYKLERLSSGYSLGGFGGIGASLIDPTVTRDAINFEYEGIVANFGVAGTFALQRLNVGVAVGLDYLLDENASAWIYQGQPWLGFVVGVNLN